MKGVTVSQMVKYEEDDRKKKGIIPPTKKRTRGRDASSKGGRQVEMRLRLSLNDLTRYNKSKRRTV